MTRQARRITTATRRYLGGAALLGAGAVAAFVLASSASMADDGPAKALTFVNETGVLRTLYAREGFDRDNPFFQELGSTGRTCATCHRPA